MGNHLNIYKKYGHLKVTINDYIPDEILLIIYDCLDLTTLHNIMLLNKKFNNEIPFNLIIKKFTEYYDYIEKNIMKYHILFDKINNNYEQLIYLYNLNKNINIFNIAAEYGRNDILLRLKDEYSEIKGTDDAFNLAVENDHCDTLILIKQKFSYIKGSPNIWYDIAYKGKSEMLKIFALEFKNLIPDKKYTQSIFENALKKGDINTLDVIKKYYIKQNLFFTMYGTFKEYDELIETDNKEVILYLSKEYPKIRGIKNKCILVI